MEISVYEMDIYKSIKAAKTEHEVAKNRLDFAETEREIDMAIYSMYAAEEKLSRLVAMAKGETVEMDRRTI